MNGITASCGLMKNVQNL